MWGKLGLVVVNFPSLTHAIRNLTVLVGQAKGAGIVWFFFLLSLVRLCMGGSLNSSFGSWPASQKGHEGPCPWANHDSQFSLFSLSVYSANHARMMAWLAKCVFARFTMESVIHLCSDVSRNLRRIIENGKFQLVFFVSSNLGKQRSTISVLITTNHTFTMALIPMVCLKS
jgi:hypothetical protein